MIAPKLTYETIQLGAGFNNIEGNISHPFTNWNVLWVFIEGVTYNIVYRPPVDQEVRYDSVAGKFITGDISDSNRNMTVIIKL